MLGSVHIPNWTDFSQRYKVTSLPYPHVVHLVNPPVQVSVRVSLAAAVIVNTTIAVVSIYFMRRNDRVLTLTKYANSE